MYFWGIILSSIVDIALILDAFKVEAVNHC